MEDEVARAPAGLDSDRDHEELCVGVRSGVPWGALRGGTPWLTSLFIGRQITVVDFPPFEVVRVDPELWCLSNRTVPVMHALFRFDTAPDADANSLSTQMSCANRLSLNPPVVRTCRVHNRGVLFWFWCMVQGSERAEQGRKKATQAKHGGRKTVAVPGQTCWSKSAQTTRPIAQFVGAPFSFSTVCAI